jgi:hypothetical protein
MTDLTTFEACSIIEDFDGRTPSREEVVAAFQSLINTKVVWSLQGFYGRTAQRLIDSGECHA